MSDSITISAEQAALVEAGEPFVVEGDGYWLHEDSTLHTGPPAVWAAADQPCPTCNGEQFWEDQIPRLADREAEPYGCGTCHGTGRTVTELVTSGNIDRPPAYISGELSLGMFTIQCLPITEDGYNDELTPDKWGVNWDDDLAFVALGLPNQPTVFYMVDGSAEQITLPPTAKPGQYAVIATKVET